MNELEGRTAEQKLALTKAINDAMVEHSGINPELLHIVITEYPHGHWSRRCADERHSTRLIKPKRCRLPRSM